ncbi:hypothetical protein BDZ89DRAFT_1077401 [Hymenopellis radicata]|nr:hypothetical protein BDZ89DRAFT_1077401 [Hymenopellis radicata]
MVAPMNNGSGPYAPVATTSAVLPSSGPGRGAKRKEHPDASRPKTTRAFDRCRDKKTKCNLNMSTTPRRRAGYVPLYLWSAGSTYQ